MAKFNPNEVTFAEGAVRVERVLAAQKINVDSKILTSQDRESRALRELLPVSAVPEGFKKWQLPFVFDKAQFFMTEAAPGADANEHAHEGGSGIRFILSGSITHNGVELKAGDWMYIPRGARYSFKVGPHGATMGYRYQCCCGGALDIKKWLGDPAPDVR